MALVAVSCATPVAAGPLLCGDITDHLSVQMPCNDLVKNGLVKNGLVKNKRFFPPLHPLGSSADWSVGKVFIHDGKWAQMQLHGRSPIHNIPEPGGLALLGLGLVGVALARRFQRRQ